MDRYDFMFKDTSRETELTTNLNIFLSQTTSNIDRESLLLEFAIILSVSSWQYSNS